MRVRLFEYPHTLLHQKIMTVDGQRANEVDLERWTRRGWWHKLKDNAFYLLNELL